MGSGSGCASCGKMCPKSGHVQEHIAHEYEGVKGKEEVEGGGGGSIGGGC